MKVGLFGANGRMGRVLIEALNEHEQASLSVASVRDDSPWVGMDVGELAGIGKLNTACEGVSGLNPDDVDVMIDFTLPDIPANLVVVQTLPQPLISRNWAA